MAGVQDAIQDGVPHVHVARGHVDLGAQHARTVGQVAAPHLLEEILVLLDRTGAIGAILAGLGQTAAIRTDLVGAEVIDVGLALLDQLDRPLVERLEVVGGIE